LKFEKKSENAKQRNKNENGKIKEEIEMRKNIGLTGKPGINPIKKLSLKSPH